MRILIVDDEALVRNGLRDAIDWPGLGITEVLLAEDGLEALTIARKSRPEILLTDVRMQRMDGIRLAATLRKELPQCQLIFMSGYSDKEYLKAAIQYKAVSYVEKPIDLREISTAVSEAVRLLREHSSNLEAQTVRNHMEKSQLAEALCRQEVQAEQLVRSWSDLGLPNSGKLWFYSLLLQPGEEISFDQELIGQLNQEAQGQKLDFLYCSAGNGGLSLHVFGEKEPLQERIQRFLRGIQRLLPTDTCIAVGKPVHSLGQVWQSFRSGEEALQDSFYERTGVFFWDARQPGETEGLEKAVEAFRSALSIADYAAAAQVEEELYAHILRHKAPVDAVKNTYYRLISVLEWIAAKNCISLTAVLQDRYPWQVIGGIRSASALHSCFVQLLTSYTLQAQQGQQENELVVIMKDHIRKNYHRDTLTVREIAEVACLSTAYACTLFKSETGVTINQYISDCRIEKAKQLLADPRCKITDIALQIGYSDSNYFGKSFKKLVGLAPSEYREKVSKWVL